MIVGCLFMDDALRALLRSMLNKRCIGNKHTPEEKIVNSKTKWLKKEELREFERGYKALINENAIIRTRKKTGKGTGWHISLNPRCLNFIYRLLDDEHG